MVDKLAGRCMMQIEVLLFASLRDLAQSDSIAVELPADASVSDLVEAISEQFPPLADRLPNTRVAVDDRFCSPEDRISAGSEVALIPPVSGG
ncbi:MAG: MoaD/ThiS family protein [Planctomycetes bacterium]|nr:MoaD/ThiS family protein [Planctomycetota bacterium]